MCGICSWLWNGVHVTLSNTMSSPKKALLYRFPLTPAYSVQHHQTKAAGMEKLPAQPARGAAGTAGGAGRGGGRRSGDTRIRGQPAGMETFPAAGSEWLLFLWKINKSETYRGFHNKDNGNAGPLTDFNFSGQLKK